MARGFKCFLFLSLFVTVSGCELFPFLDRKNEVKFKEVFRYTENNSSWGVELISVTGGGFAYLVEESYLPRAYTLLRLDRSFNIIWKVSFEYLYFTDVAEMKGGDFLLSGGRVLMRINHDGSQSSQVQFNREQVVNAFVLPDRNIIVHGLDENYDPFVAKYDENLNRIWINQEKYSRVFALDENNGMYGVNPLGDSLRFYSADGRLMSNNRLKNVDPFVAVALMKDKANNFIMAGTTDPGNCCCNDNITVFKCDAEGNKLWETTLGSRNANDDATSLTMLDGFLYVTGHFGESDCLGPGFDGNYSSFYVAKISFDGTLFWQKALGDPTTHDGASVFLSTHDGNFVAGGLGDTDLSTVAIIYRIEED